MIGWFVAIHILAYMPSAIFLDLSSFLGFIFRSVRHAIGTWKDYQYVMFIAAMVCIIYPIVSFL